MKRYARFIIRNHGAVFAAVNAIGAQIVTPLGKLRV
jgi:hypothetical protein